MRTYTKIIGSIFLASALATIGCGPSDNTNNGGGGSSGSSTTVDELGQKLLDAICGTGVQCGRFASPAECKASTQINLDEMKAYLENGTVTYHPDKADACLAVFATAGGCTYSESALGNENDIEAACKDVFQGTIANGGDCFDDEQCISNECMPPDMCMEQCCVGKCQAATAPSPPAKIGESCAMDGVECETGAYCQSDSMGNPTTCAAQVDVGQACSDFYACKAPAICDLDFMTGMGTCVVPAASGKTCDPDSILPCDRFDEECDPMTLVCTPPKAVGEACSDMIACVAYAYCDQASMKCVKRPGAGETCDPMNSQCMGDLNCINGKCGFEPPVVCK